MNNHVVRAALLAAGLTSAVLAQVSSIQGVVTDSSGSVVPGAVVRTTNIATGIVYSATTNEAGFYVVPALNAGSYKVSASSKGFAPQERPEVRLEVASSRALILR